MKELSQSKKSLWQEIKTDNYIDRIFTSLYSMALGAFLATTYGSLQGFIILIMIITFIAIFFRIIYLEYFKQLPAIKVDNELLTIRGESFKKEQIEYISYTKEDSNKDDFLKVKLKGFEERHICVYEDFFRGDLRLYNFINDNFMPVKLIRN